MLEEQGEHHNIKQRDAVSLVRRTRFSMSIRVHLFLLVACALIFFLSFHSYVSNLMLMFTVRILLFVSITVGGQTGTVWVASRGWI